MRRFFYTILLAFIAFAFSTSVFAQNPQLPDGCRKILDRNFRGWKFTPIAAEIKNFLRENFARNNEGNLISGDWNGDGKKDFAVLINHGSVTLNDGTKLSRELTVAFIHHGKGYKYFVLDTAGDYISFEKKGTKAYDHNTQSGVKFANDAIFVGLWEKAGRSYVWHKNKFIYFQTSD